jgi:hypothetical protein
MMLSRYFDGSDAVKEARYRSLMAVLDRMEAPESLEETQPGRTLGDGRTSLPATATRTPASHERSPSSSPIDRDATLALILELARCR